MYNLIHLNTVENSTGIVKETLTEKVCEWGNSRIKLEFKTRLRRVGLPEALIKDILEKGYFESGNITYSISYSILPKEYLPIE